AREGAQRAYDTSLARIEQLVQDFSRIEGTAQATAVYEELTRILQEEGVEPALAYLEKKRGDVFTRVRTQKELVRSELRPFLTGARLKAVNGQAASARK